MTTDQTTDQTADRDQRRALLRARHARELVDLAARHQAEQDDAGLTRPGVVTRAINVEFADQRDWTPLPPCPAGWKPEPYVEYDGGDLAVSITSDTGEMVTWERRGEDVLSDIESDLAEVVNGHQQRLGLSDEAWDELHAYGATVYERVDIDTYFLASAALSAYYDLVVARAVTAV